MDNEQARFILSAYRAGGQDASDSQFAEALEQARRDPQLAQWLAGETALDAAISTSLKSIPVPAGLKAAILAGQKIVHPQPWWRRRIHPAAAAAALAITAATIGYLAIREPAGSRADFKGFTEDITEHIGSGDGMLLRQPKIVQTEMGFYLGPGYRPRYRSASIGDIRHWLDQNNGHGNCAIPSRLQGFPNLGCGVMVWRGRPVTLISFQAGSRIQSPKVHLAVISSADLTDPPARGRLRFHDHQECTTASWSDGNFTYVLMAPGPREALERFL